MRAAQTADPRKGRRSSGQVVVIFAAAMFVLMAMMAIAIDVSWLWSNALRVQRAADAAALAGAVTLPNDPTRGAQLARREATKNGYTQAGDGSVVVTPSQDPANPHRMHVVISAQVDTFFMRLVGLNTVRMTRESRAEFNQPIPMGSPQNYYGVGLFNLPQLDHDSTGLQTAGRSESGNWLNPDRATDDGGGRTSEDTTGELQRWDSFGLLNLIPDDPSLVIEGIQVELEDIRLSGAGASVNCRVDVELSWNNGLNFTPPQPQDVNFIADATFVVGDDNTMSGWGPHVWNRGAFSDEAFEVRLTWAEGTGCDPAHGVELDRLRVEVFYRTTGVATPQPVVAPDGTVLASQNFWGSMQSYGAPAFQGDAHMTRYATRKSPDNDAFDPEEYYNYAVVVPSGASNAEVHIFDPGFCDVGRDRNDGQQGTDESWTVDSGNSRGNPTTKPVSAFYELWDTLDTPYDRADDVLKFTSGNQFRRLNFYDPTLNGENGASGSGAAPTSCTGEGWHNNWWLLASGLSPGTYRVHTASKLLLDSADDQSDTTGLNGFAIWAKASGGMPRVHGLGAMEAYFPLPAGGPSRFYLAQVDENALGLQLSHTVQVSTNIEDHTRVTAADVVELVRRHATVTGAELVAPAPRAALENFPKDVPLRGPKPLEDHLPS